MKLTMTLVAVAMLGTAGFTAADEWSVNVNLPTMKTAASQAVIEGGPVLIKSEVSPSATLPELKGVAMRSGETVSDMLKRYYDGSNQPAEIADFDFNTDDEQRCIYVEKGSNDWSYIYVNRLVKMTPEAGPLIPGQRSEKVAILEARKGGRSWVMDDKYFDSIENYTTETDLVAHVQSLWTTHLLTQRYRKNSGMIFFSITLDKGTPDPDYFGYCWREK